MPYPALNEQKMQGVAFSLTLLLAKRRGKISSVCNEKEQFWHLCKPEK